MKKIHLLKEDVITKIAAGEIVERPCHIVKELVENSLDATASTVTISIIEGGKKSISVQDNGHGIPKEDAILAIGHHTTSKISSEKDLESLITYGFRGEALSSIASVSNFTLITRTDTQQEGYIVEVAGGKILHHGITPAPVGTTVIAKDLFFNTPARQKFLKKESTELNQIKQLFFAQCFSALSVHFSLKHNTHTLYSCPGVKTVLDRFIQLEGLEASKHMLSLIHETETDTLFSLSGIISDTQYVSYDRSDIFILVNNRWVKNSSLIRALINGYGGSLPAQKFPRAVLHLTIDPQEVDINIHPKKEEVRFLHPKRIEIALQEAVKRTLESRISPAIFLKKTESSFSKPSLVYQEIHHASFEQKKEERPFQQKELQNHHITPFFQEARNSADTRTMFDLPQPISTNSIEEKQHSISVQELQCIGQLFQTYILASNTTSFYLIDQHAAHERILFEKTVRENQGLLSVKQAFPLMISLGKEATDIITNYAALFASCGIVLERFDQTTVIITATPAHFMHHDFKALCEEVVIMINEEKSIEKREIEEKLLYKIRCSIACKAAVKAGDQLDMIFMIQLISELSVTNNRFCCPHGRPTMWELSQYEIEKKFKRKI